jgi:hypothetical protein
MPELVEMKTRLLPAAINLLPSAEQAMPFMLSGASVCTQVWANPELTANIQKKPIKCELI